MDSQNNQEQANTQNTNQQSVPVQPVASAPSNHAVLAAIAYIGPLVIISYLMAKDNEFVKFHTKQGLVVFGINVLIWVISSMMYNFGMIGNLINIATFILSIIGIVNVVQGQKKELPVVGGLAKSINI